MASILRIPREIQLKFLDLLDYSDLKSLRQTCRTFEPLPAARLFETVTVVLSRRGLSRLRNIALHPTTAKHVREMEFPGGRLDYFPCRDLWETEIERRRQQAEKVHFPSGLDPYNEYGKPRLEEGWSYYQNLLAEQEVI
jgi:hypothetical protein